MIWFSEVTPLMFRPSFRLFCVLLGVVFGGGPWSAAEENGSKSAATGKRNTVRKVKRRRFRFDYRVTVTNLKPGGRARIWIPIAASDAQQDVSICKVSLPGKFRRAKDGRFGNEMFFVEATADERGRIPLSIEYVVQRREATPTNREPVKKQQRRLFVKPNRLVPLGGKPLAALFNGKSPVGEPRKIARQIYDRVEGHVRYHKPPGGKWGRGDAGWVCDSRFGNCSDFHSLFISLCRTAGIPARFRIGFPLPPGKKTGRVSGYHCWAEFADGRIWAPVDISEADKTPDMRDYYFGRLTPDRVLFSTGRDLILKPRQKSGPVNFFVYPHVEVEGKRHTAMIKQFRYTDLPDGRK